MKSIIKYLSLNCLYLVTLVLNQNNLVYGSPNDFVGKQIDTSSVYQLCQSCPTQLKITEETIHHSIQHYPVDLIQTPDQARQFAREDRTTSILLEENSFDLVLDALTHSQGDWALDKKAQDRLSKGAETIAYQARISTPSLQNGTEYTDFLVVLCVSDSCDDDAGGVIRKNVFKRHDVVSIYPICGPKVIQLPKRKALKETFRPQSKRCN